QGRQRRWSHAAILVKVTVTRQNGEREELTREQAPEKAAAIQVIARTRHAARGIFRSIYRNVRRRRFAENHTCSRQSPGPTWKIVTGVLYTSGLCLRLRDRTD